MFLLGILLSFFSRGVHCSSSGLDCLEARRSCQEQRQCRTLLEHLDLCLERDADGLLDQAEARQGCLQTQSSLLQMKRHLLHCRCQRGSRKEERCIRAYWTFRFPQGYDDIESSPYEDMEEELRRSLDTLRINSLVAASSPSLDGQNQCLKAAQYCGMFEKCGALRSEYAAACTKPAAEGTDRCNRQKCHRALRRYLERVPEDYSLPVLFCPCSDPLCGERRRKTIVPSCSYEDHEYDRPPNCLHLKGLCMTDNLCRARLADFQHHCQPSEYSSSGCARESRAMCLKAYTGLIGTVMTPNYVQNSSMDVALWCNCEGSGNHWQDCQHLQHLFTDNTCLSNAITTMGSFLLHPEEGVAPPPPAPSQITQHHQLNVNLQSALNSVETSQEEEEEKEEQEAVKDEEEIVERFHVIPPYSEKATVSNLNSAGRSVHTGSMLSLQRPLLAPALPLLLSFLLITLTLSCPFT